MLYCFYCCCLLLIAVHTRLVEKVNAHIDRTELDLHNTIDSSLVHGTSTNDYEDDEALFAPPANDNSRNLSRKFERCSRSTKNYHSDCDDNDDEEGEVSDKFDDDDG